MPSLWHNLAQLSEYFRKSSEPLDRDGAHPLPSLLTQDLEDIDYVAQHGPPFSLSDLPAYIDAVKNFSGVGLDDRKFLLEKLLVLMSRLPSDSGFSDKLQQFVIEILYKDLPHPPSSYLALPSTQHVSAEPELRNVKYAYRSADGSNYNPLFPSLGKAGSPYARSVPSTHSISPSSLPEPSLVFDTLLKREHFAPHPGGISSLFFAFADLIIHSIFNTSHQNWTINNASSYLDLSVLYGSSEQQVDAVRRKDGTGKLWEDVFADGRLLFMPPSVGALLVIFCRNHNYIADKLLSINENRSFSNSPPQDPVALRAQDDEIFHRTRLVNTGFFMQIILRDYVGAILGLIRDGSSWRLDPLMSARQLDHNPFPQGQGNAVSLEFNLLYRWHAAISAHDEKWTEDLFEKLFPGKDFNDITIQDFQQAAHQHMIPDPDIKKWTFAGLKRDVNGRFNDSDIAAIIQGATESSASAFKARGIPSALRVIEIMGIEQSRSWGASSLNEFRKFMGLKPYASFSEWNPDPEIHNAAAALYHDIDNLEVYVGMQAEEAKVPMPGAGLCPGYTISRAILSDAVCLTRGDRFLTVDFTPFNLTVWGYNDCQPNVHDGAFGGMLSKLLLRHLPEYYPSNSAYGLFPFMVPEKMKEYIALQTGSSVGDYDWTKPSGITQTPLSVDARISKIMKVPAVNVKQVIFSAEYIETWRKSYQQITKWLIRERSATQVGSSEKRIDVVRDVINLAPVRWIANSVMGLPLKTVDNPSGVYREHEMYAMFADVANYVFVNADVSSNWYLRELSTNTATIVDENVVSRIHQTSQDPIGMLKRLVDYSHWTSTSKAFLMKLTSSIKALSSALAGGLFAETVATAALYSRALAHVVDYFLRDEMEAARKAFEVDSSEADAEIISHIRQALHGNNLVPHISNGSSMSTTIGKPSGAEAYGMMTPDFFEKTAVEILRVIFTLPRVRRVAGQSGQLGSFKNEVSRGVFQDAYIDMDGKITPWPVSLIIQYN